MKLKKLKGMLCCLLSVAFLVSEAGSVVAFAQNDEVMVETEEESENTKAEENTEEAEATETEENTEEAEATETEESTEEAETTEIVETETEEKSENTETEENTEEVEATETAESTEEVEATETEESTQEAETTEIVEKETAEESENTETEESTEKVEATETEENTEEVEAIETEESTEEAETTENKGNTEEAEVTEVMEKAEEAEATETVEKSEEVEALGTGKTETVKTLEETEKIKNVKVEAAGLFTEKVSNDPCGIVDITPGTTFYNAEQIELNTVYSVSAKQSAKHYYKFTLKKPGLVDLNFANHGTTDSGYFTVYFKYEKAGGYLFRESISDNADYQSNRVGLNAGTYYIYVKNSILGAEEGTTYSLELNYTETSNCERESNGSFSTATEIPVNTDIYGSGYESGDEDYYKIVLSKPGVIDFELKHGKIVGYEATEVYYMDFYNAIDGKSLFTFSVKGAETQMTSQKIGLPAGTYYLKLKTNAKVSDNYILRVENTESNYWEREVNDDYSVATEMKKLNTAYSGSISRSADVDYYMLKLDKDGAISLKFTHSLVPGHENDSVWKIALYFAADLNSAVYSQTITGSNTSVTTPQIGLAAGTYYVKVTGSSYYDTGVYTLQAKHKESAYWEKERNDNFDMATSLESGKTYSGSIKNTADVDYYKIKTKEAGYLQLKLKQSSQIADKVYRIKVYNSDNSEIYNTYIIGTDAEFVSCKLGVGKGTYYVRVESFVNLYTGTYKLTLTSTAASNWESEINDEKSQADTIKVGKKVTGVCDDGYSDYDWYKFTLDKAAYINISLSHKNLNDSGTGWYVQLYDSKGNTIRKNGSLAVSQSGTYEKTGNSKLEKGTYYIRVYANDYGEGEEYGLTVNKVSAKAPTIKSVTSKSYKKINVTWSMVAGADKYIIYRSTSKDGKYTKVKTISDVSVTSWNDTNVKTGTTYYYKMKSVVITDKEVTSKYSGVKSAKCVPAKPSVKAESSKKGQIKISWKKIDGASGYVVYRATSKDGEYKKLKTITKGSTVSYTDKKASSGKKYYYKVRAYRTVNNKKVYSSYSSVVSQKAK